MEDQGSLKNMEYMSPLDIIYEGNYKDEDSSAAPQVLSITSGKSMDEEDGSHMSISHNLEWILENLSSDEDDASASHNDHVHNDLILHILQI
ncbi:hypothetical protein P7K49_037809 [Saguinus oedipus]|uniref:Uncharacterized protein n=1 Tax=Saguinus oedipus TaxID=9490 RepID=A0ABQ9TJ76_SAGOE|nr:hypothetical protein P7K49_037809 [Saguinus oedipus]